MGHLTEVAEIEVVCSRCGEELDIDLATVTEKGQELPHLRVLVDPCDTCEWDHNREGYDEGRDEGYDEGYDDGSNHV